MSIKRFTKRATDNRIPLDSEYYLLSLSSNTPATGYSLVRKDLKKEEPDRVVGFVSLNPKTGTWAWETMLSDYSYGKFETPELAAEELIKKTSSVKGFTKQSGIFDWLKKEKPQELEYSKKQDRLRKQKLEKSRQGPTGVGVISPASKAEQVQYLAKKINQQLASTPLEQHEQFVKNTLAQHKIGTTDPRYAEILSLLSNYQHSVAVREQPRTPSEVKWKD